MALDVSFWQRALDSQCASNLQGLVNFLPSVFKALKEDGVQDTAALNKHPIVRLIVAQMAHLAYGSFDCNSDNHWLSAYLLARVHTGLHPHENRKLLPGEKEEILAVWESLEEDKPHVE